MCFKVLFEILHHFERRLNSFVIAGSRDADKRTSLVHYYNIIITYYPTLLRTVQIARETSTNNKQLLDEVFVMSRIIKVSVRVISLKLRLRLITPTSTLIILDITKTQSNNCFIIH